MCWKVLRTFQSWSMIAAARPSRRWLIARCWRAWQSATCRWECGKNAANFVIRDVFLEYIFLWVNCLWCVFECAFLGTLGILTLVESIFRRFSGPDSCAASQRRPEPSVPQNAPASMELAQRQNRQRLVAEGRCGCRRYKGTNLLKMMIVSCLVSCFL